MKTTKIKSLEKKRLELVNLAKNTVNKYGWNDSLFEKISSHNRITHEELVILFPDGYIQMLKLLLGGEFMILVYIINIKTWVLIIIASQLYFYIL